MCVNIHILSRRVSSNSLLCGAYLILLPVYAPDMPSKLPPVLLARRLSQHALLAVLFVLRAIAVAIIWLAVLPWVTVWTWRMYFSMGEST
jgi:E3 ubiquitin-protein ligase DOA10